MPEQPTLQFLGGAGTVTGSKYLIHFNSKQILLDCGLFQGLKELRQRNWQKPPFEPNKIDAIILSHAHIDHTGYLPLVARHGYEAPIICTPGTLALLNVILPDCGHLQEEEAKNANRFGYSKHKPALPLFTTKDSQRVLELVRPYPYHQTIDVTDGVKLVFRRAAHILGSATVELQFENASKNTKLVFSGDLGRYHNPILHDPDPVPEADFLLIESTYGDRVHVGNVQESLAQTILEAAERGGALLVPAFAVGRTQELVWRIRELEDARRIPKLPIYVDSPMAINANEIFCQHPDDHSIDMATLMDEHRCPLCCTPYHLLRTADESKSLHDLDGPMIVISASGMATGGRILHHLKRRLPDRKNTVLLVGFQAMGTRGRSLQDGAKHVRIHGQEIPVRAKIETLHGLSAHADQLEILHWLSGFKKHPQQVYIVHGEPATSQALALKLREELHWNCQVAQDRQIAMLEKKN